MLRPGELLIHDGNAHLVMNPVVNGDQKAHGLVPRDYAKHPVGSYPWATAVDFPLIDPGEYATRLADMVAQKSQLSDIRLTGNAGQSIPSRDQNGKGYCWAHSGVSAHLCIRALANDPYVDLSAYAVACIIKNYRDEGGWGAQGVDWEVQNGCPSSQFWPQQSMSSGNDTPAMRANAKLHLITAQWADLSQGQYDRNLTWAQVCTLVLCRNPVVTDYNWWSHSVCGIDLVNGTTAAARQTTRDPISGKLVDFPTFERVWAINHPVTQGFGLRIWNSWGDSWSDRGMGVLTGNKAIPDGAVAPRIVLPSES